MEGRRSRCGSNGAGRDPRNPGKPVKNGKMFFGGIGVLQKKVPQEENETY